MGVSRWFDAQGSQSPAAPTESERISVVVISLCRDQYHEGMKEKALDEIILKNRVSFSDIADNPSLLEHPNVMFFADRKPISLEEAVSRIMDMAREADKLNMISSTTSQVAESAGSKVGAQAAEELSRVVGGAADLAAAGRRERAAVYPGRGRALRGAVQGVGARKEVKGRFLLSKDTKIIISDVDGTITREDVMGHVMYAIHQDYTQSGIVRMYNRLSVGAEGNCHAGQRILDLVSHRAGRRADEGHTELPGGNRAGGKAYAAGTDYLLPESHICELDSRGGAAKAAGVQNPGAAVDCGYVCA